MFKCKHGHKNKRSKNFCETCKYKAYQKAYQKTDKYKAYRKAYRKAYQKSDKYKAYQRAYMRARRAENWTPPKSSMHDEYRLSPTRREAEMHKFVMQYPKKKARDVNEIQNNRRNVKQFQETTPR